MYRGVTKDEGRRNRSGTPESKRKEIKRLREGQGAETVKTPGVYSFHNYFVAGELALRKEDNKTERLYASRSSSNHLGDRAGRPRIMTCYAAVKNKVCRYQERNCRWKANAKGEVRRVKKNGALMSS